MNEGDFVDKYLDHVARVIEEHGVAIQWVAASHPPNSEHEPSYTYTIGLAKIDHPEIIIFDLPPETAHDVLNGMALPVVTGGMRWSPGFDSQVFGGGVKALLIPVNDSAYHLKIANRMFAIPGQGPVPALQVVYPDVNGRWPWDWGSLVAGQPLLGSRFLQQHIVPNG